MQLIENLTIQSNSEISITSNIFSQPSIYTKIDSSLPYPTTWVALGRLLFLVPVNINGFINYAIAREEKIYLPYPSYFEVDYAAYKLGVLPVDWLYSKSLKLSKLKIYAN